MHQIHITFQKIIMTNKNDIEIPKINFGKDGELIITASQTSSQHDFDFYEGK